MTEPTATATRGAVAGRGLATLAGWYLTMAGIVALSWDSTAKRWICASIRCVDDPLYDTFFGYAVAFGQLIALAVSVGIAILVLTVAVLLRIRSGILAGTLAAFVSFVILAPALVVAQTVAVET
jgi:hypothetical protein